MQQVQMPRRMDVKTTNSGGHICSLVFSTFQLRNGVTQINTSGSDTVFLLNLPCISQKLTENSLIGVLNQRLRLSACFFNPQVIQRFSSH